MVSPFSCQYALMPDADSSLLMQHTVTSPEEPYRLYIRCITGSSCLQSGQPVWKNTITETFPRRFPEEILLPSFMVTLNDGNVSPGRRSAPSGILSRMHAAAIRVATAVIRYLACPMCPGFLEKR